MSDYELEVCDECDYQWDKKSSPVHRETCSKADEDNFFGSSDPINVGEVGAIQSNVKHGQIANALLKIESLFKSDRPTDIETEILRECRVSLVEIVDQSYKGEYSQVDDEMDNLKEHLDVLEEEVGK